MMTWFVHANRLDAFLSKSHDLDLQQGVLWNTPKKYFSPSFESMTLVSSKSDGHTIRHSAGITLHMDTERLLIVGVIWLSSTYLMSILVLLLWKHSSLTSTSVTRQMCFPGMVLCLVMTRSINKNPYMSMFSSFCSAAAFTEHAASLNPGRPGCRNVKRGGDNATPPSLASESWRWYCTYVVHRSFKCPPAIPRLENSKLSPGGWWTFHTCLKFVLMLGTLRGKNHVLCPGHFTSLPLHPWVSSRSDLINGKHTHTHAWSI